MQLNELTNLAYPAAEGDHAYPVLFFLMFVSLSLMCMWLRHDIFILFHSASAGRQQVDFYNF